jgi:ABC-type transporter Mla subunit MlaD
MAQDRVRIITDDGPEGSIIEVRILDAKVKSQVDRYVATLRKLRDVQDDARERLENDNQAGVPEEEAKWNLAIQSAANEVRNFRPFELTDADGHFHQLNTDPDEALPLYQTLLDERDSPV